MTPTNHPHHVARNLLPLKALRTGLIIGLLPVISGCTYMASSGPSADRIHHDAQSASKPDSYQLIPITNDVVHTINRKRVASEWNSFTVPGTASKSRLALRSSVPGMDKLPAAASQTIAVGDAVQVTIFETGGALFGVSSSTGSTPSGSASTQLPLQMVDESGAITVPYAGRIPVKGRSPHEIEAEIVEKLKPKAINVQAIVTIGDRKGGNLVTVTGDVKTPTQIPLSYAGGRLLDALTAAGGSSGKPYDTMLSVIRGSKVRSDSLAEISNHPSKNIALQAGDTVVVKTEPRAYMTFGAVRKNGRTPFDTDQISLAEAMAVAGGADDDKANPRAIFVYRLEPRSVVEKLGHNPGSTMDGGVPVIYQLDLASPKGYFLAQSFDVQDKDIIYFANAGSVGLTKFLSLLGVVTSGATRSVSTASGL